MRHLLPMTLLAAVLLSGPAPSDAKPPHERPRRAPSHVSFHLSTHHALASASVVLRGRVHPRGAHRVKVVVRGRRGAVIGTTSRRDGSFVTRWRPRGVGSYRARAYLVHDPRTKASVSSARRLTAYRHAEASYYGPGLYGNGMACGGTLLPGTLGVAHKTLPCGAKVRLRYGGRSVTVPVVDRGPYVAGRDFDLTEATKERLGFPGVAVLLASR